jgi:threonine synthase
VLYPEGQVSDVQEAQMASLGDNVTALSIRGTFDDCQRLVKQAFADDDLRRYVWLTPANSINLGRLLPQAFYYFLLAGPPKGGPGDETSSGPSLGGPIISVPSGNFGNLTAGLIAKRLGLHVCRFVAATNVNDAVPEYLRTGRYQPRPSIATVANAMDVGAPSNFERMQSLYGGNIEALRRDIVGFAYDDARVTAEIGEVYRKHGYLLDPHSAIAWLALQEQLMNDADAHGVFLSTAHPAKFREVVEPAIGQRIELPKVLADAISRPRHSVSMAADYNDLKAFLRS